MYAHIPTREEIRFKWRRCKECPLHKSRHKVVLSRGKGRLLLIGEAPGYNEDLEGEPFVGASGKLLSLILKNAGIPEEDISVTNIVACRPTDREGYNRVPTQKEIEACSPRLADEVARVDPLLLILLGATPVRTLTGSKAAMTRLVGKLLMATLEWQGMKGEVPAFVCWHPAYILRRDPTRRTAGEFGKAVRIFKTAKVLYEYLKELDTGRASPWKVLDAKKMSK